MRAIALIVLLAVPLLVAATYSYVREREAARRAAESRALNIAVLAQREYQLRAATAHERDDAVGGRAAVHRQRDGHAV